MNNTFDQLVSQEQIDRAVAALAGNGMKAYVVADAAQAKAKALEIIPTGAEVMNMTSVTLDTVTLVQEILESGKFKPARDLLNDASANPDEKRRHGAAPEWAVGSVHALTEDGSAIIASNTGSQLPAYAYGATHVLWVVGAQKIVPDLETGLKRLREYVLPLESERANKAYSITTGSNISKLLIVSKELQQDRITTIIVKEKLGF